MKTIFILKGLTIKPKTLDDWEKERIIFNLDLSTEKQMELEDFIDFQKGFGGCHDYVISDYNHAYFLDEQMAIDCAKGDIGGLNDGGVYDYAAVIEVPCGFSYPELGEIVSFHLFKYDYSLFEFVEIYMGNEYDACKKYFYITN